MNRKFLWLVALLAFLLAACQGETQTPTPSSPPAPSETPAPTHTAAATPTPSLTPQPTETLFPTQTPFPSHTPSSTPPTYVRGNTPIPVPDEPITAGNADQIVELARLGKGAIQEVQLSPNRLYLLVRTTIGVYGYDANRLEELWAFEDPAGIAALAVPQLERWIAVATNDGRIALLIYQRGSMFTQWVSGYSEIYNLAFSYDGEMLAAIGDNGATIWQVGQTEPLYEYPRLKGENVRFTPGGESFTILDDGKLSFALIESGEIQKIVGTTIDQPVYTVDGQRFSDLDSIWDANTGEKLVELETPEQSTLTNKLTFSQNGKYLAGAVYPYEEDLGIVIWQADTGNYLFTLQSPFSVSNKSQNSTKLASPANLSGPPRNYFQLAFSPDGRLLAAAHESGYVDLWDLETNVFIDRYTDLGTNVIFRKASRLTIWDTLEIHDIEPRNGILINSARDFVAGRKLNFSPEGRWLLADWVVWDLDNLQRAFRFGDEIVSTISQNGEYIYSYDWYQRTLYQRRLDDFGLVEQVEFIWDFPDYYTKLNPIIWGPQPYKFSISPNGNYFSISAYDIGNHTWDTDRNELIPELHTSFYSDTRHDYSPDGKFLAITSEEQVSLFQLEPEIQFIQGISGSACGFSPDGNYLVIQHNERPFLYSLKENGKFASTINLEMELREYFCVSAFKREEVFAGATWTEVTLADVETGETLITIPAHLDEIASLAFSPNGKYLATSSYDGTVKLWGIPPGE